MARAGSRLARANVLKERDGRDLFPAHHGVSKIGGEGVSVREGSLGGVDIEHLDVGEVLVHMKACSASSRAGVMTHFVTLFQFVEAASDGAAGCAVAGATIDVPANDGEPWVGAREVFPSRVAFLALQLWKVGIAWKRAEGFAMISIASVEGALIVCRAEGGVAPMDAVAKSYSF